uniref:Small ribosomal subunit protein uS14c n=1 Tax=Cyanophora paradoxa TaxID=2762 RepID=RR14_CYAPA|nr:ribosomal protein S14 [Cyanophora paradoxa]P48138.1 RecName: Full=Small ribosomal subunit protein uS14c; AltName: Full=Cyanelle 30S ribosomal protein S14 [Cyanophora paradoxa]AAA81179.1 ribosomal protein S14 [Cyanophora paradoxa]
MAKKSMIERDKKRENLMNKYLVKRQQLKTRLNETDSVEEKLLLNQELQKLPRNSAPSRVRIRCWLTGRPRGNYRDFGVSRHVLREMAHQGLLPGVTKSSW